MTTPAAPSGDTSDPGVEKVRAWTGLTAVIAGDVAIAVAAILGITHFATNAPANAQIFPQDRGHPEQRLYSYWHYDHGLLWH